MFRCAILDDYQDAALSHGAFERLSGRVGFTTLREHIADTETLCARLQPFDIVIAMRERTAFDAARLGALPNLKLLVTTGMTNASIDLEAARTMGIMVCGTGGFGGSTAELVWGLLLAHMRQIPREHANFRSGGPWQLSVGRDLRGLTLGVIGLGALGTRVAGIGKAFGMTVIGWSRNNTPERSKTLGIGFSATLDDLMASSDVVSIHIPLDDTTRGLIDARRLGLMRQHAVLVNTSRGPIVDEKALIAVLQAGRIAGACLDVFDQEPLPIDHPFRSLPNVTASPHVGYVTENSYRAYFGGVVEAIEGWLGGDIIRQIA